MIKGLYLLRQTGPADARQRVRLLGAGAILREVEAAADLLAQDFGIAADVFSVTSFSELSREARAIERDNRLNPGRPRQVSHVERLLHGNTAVIAASDYVRAVPDLIAPYVRAGLTVLGTDGFGRSDTRAALRRFFEVDRQHIALAALDRLARDGAIGPELVAHALAKYGIDAGAPAPWTI